MVSLRSGAAVIMALALLQGCARDPEIPFDRAMAPGIKTIGIVTPKVPSGPAVVLATTVGKSFGIIGALVDAGMQANRESLFKAAMASQNFVFEDVAQKSLVDCLTAEGYTVLPVPVKRDSSDFLKTYPSQSETHADAYFDAVISGYGYIAAGIGSSTPYRPGFAMRVRLVSAKDSSVLMQDAIIYNPVGPAQTTENIVTISPAADDEFVDFDSLVADPARAATDLARAIQASQAAACKLLR